MNSEKENTTLIDKETNAHEILFNSTNKSLNEKHNFSSDFIKQMNSLKDYIGDTPKANLLPNNLSEKQVVQNSHLEMVKAQTTNEQFTKPQPTVMQTPNYDFIETNGKAEIMGEQDKRRKKRKFRAKLAITVYSILLIICICWATINTVQLSNTAHQITQITYEIDSIQYLIKIDQLDCYKNGDETLITTVLEITPPPLAEPTQIQPQTNWFDRFCSWLTGIFK
ncbi:MAG: hypothetical protein PHX09_01915 [Clostridia bacterium]|nr:hypothetical protein [Clostridia bacterium]MDD4685942.1 hypothetical protein [Clostridia bacterium]